MPKDRLAALSQVQLRTIVSQIQDLLWFDIDKNAFDLVWHCYKHYLEY